MPTYPMPPGPSVWPILRKLQNASPERLDALIDLSRKYGDVAGVQAFGRRYYLISHPDDIKRVLVDDADQYHRVPGFGRDRAKVLDPVVVATQRSEHKRLRRIIQPTLTPTRLAVHVPTMQSMTAAMMTGWDSRATFDVSQWLSSLTIRMAAKCLFDSDVSDQFDQMGVALRLAQEYLTKLNRPLRVPIWVPTGSNITIWRGWSNLNTAVAKMVHERRADAGGRADMLTSLLAAVDDTDGSRLTDKEAQDNMIGLLIAGHETTAAALTWAFVLLAENPDVERALHEEVDRVLGGQSVTANDLPRLPFTEAVIREAMRLYPPAWVFTRRAFDSAELGPYALPPGTTVFMSPYVTQHDARFYDEPERFNPARWLDGLEKRNPRFAYFPFGGGGHVCTGQFFAWIEAQTLLATIAARARLIRADETVLRPYPLITLRPEQAVMMRAEMR